MSGSEATPTGAVPSQLEFLNDRMKETSETANQFLGKFLFGGMLAVIALLNADLVVLRDPLPLTLKHAPMIGGAVVGILGISWLYFATVVRHYRRFRESHRKLKYKYELTMHAMLFQAEPGDYARCLEESVDEDPPPEEQDHFPAMPNFSSVSAYLLAHHRIRFGSLKRSAWRDSHFWIAMLLVLLTLGVRLTLLLVRSPTA